MIERQKMSLRLIIRDFIRDERGAITVDWVVVTAAIGGMGLLVATSVSDGAQRLAIQIAQKLGTHAPIGQPSAGGGPTTTGTVTEH